MDQDQLVSILNALGIDNSIIETIIINSSPKLPNDDISAEMNVHSVDIPKDIKRHDLIDYFSGFCDQDSYITISGKRVIIRTKGKFNYSN